MAGAEEQSLLRDVDILTHYLLLLRHLHGEQDLQRIKFDITNGILYRNRYLTITYMFQEIKWITNNNKTCFEAAKR